MHHVTEMSFEDEIRFIFHCEKYNDIRSDLSISCRNSNPVETLDEMMSDYNMCRKLSKNLLEALREQINYIVIFTCNR